MSKRLLLLLPLFLFGCLQYEEKMKINNDGSGEVTCAIGINSSISSLSQDSTAYKGFDEHSFVEHFRNKKGIKVLGSSKKDEDGVHWIKVELSFDSVQDLVNASEDSSDFSMLTGMSLTENDRGNYVFKREIGDYDNEKKLESANDEMGKGMLEAMFGQYRWKYEITFPGKIISTNLNENEIDRSTNKIKLSYALVSLDKVNAIQVEFEKGSRLNVWMFFLLVAVSSTLGFFVYHLIKNKKDTGVSA